MNILFLYDMFCRSIKFCVCPAGMVDETVSVGGNLLIKPMYWVMQPPKRNYYLPLHEAGQVGHSLLSVCVCVFVHTITRAQMKLECLNLEQTFTLMNSGAGMFSRSKGQRSRSQGQ